MFGRCSSDSRVMFDRGPFSHLISSFAHFPLLIVALAECAERLYKDFLKTGLHIAKVPQSGSNVTQSHICRTKMMPGNPKATQRRPQVASKQL